MAKSAEDFYTENAENQAENYGDENLAQEFLDKRERFAEASGKRVLDAGCGHGRDSEFFHKRGLNVTGIDISEELIDIARERSEANFEVMDFRELNFPEESFDSIWASASIFFVPPEDMQKALGEFSKVLRPGGILFLSYKLGNGKYVNEKLGSKVEEWHISREKGREILETSGFRVEEENIDKSENGNDFISFICVKPKESR